MLGEKEVKKTVTKNQNLGTSNNTPCWEGLFTGSHSAFGPCGNLQEEPGT